jgi:hypothetical protein
VVPVVPVAGVRATLVPVARGGTAG